MDMVLDPPEEIVALFDPDAHGEAIHRFLMRPSTQSRSVSPRSSRASSRAV
jgi:5S rRNA maturation endonuclease (ribonuclease M5)